MKSEPSCYSIDDLQADTRTMWDGIRNYQVRNMIRDAIKKGDRAFFYHSSCKEIGIVGEMEVVKEAYPDPTQFDPKSEHPDLNSDPKHPRWLCVDVAFIQEFPRRIPLNALKLETSLRGMPLLQKGNRLSITPVTKQQYQKITALAKK